MNDLSPNLKTFVEYSVETDASSTVKDCLQGRISGLVAISRLLLGGADASTIQQAVARGAEPGNPDWQALADLVQDRDETLNRLASEIRITGSDHTLLDELPTIAAFFDRAVAHSPEASVALYSLGDPALLAAATKEVVDWLVSEALAPRSAAVLDLGCGTGRIAASLSCHCRTILGVDLSKGMVAEAQRRYSGMTNVRFAASDGRTFPAGAFDLILAVDSMPYMLQAGVADRLIAEAADALQPGGIIVVLNLSYGRTAIEDAADAQRWADEAGLVLTTGGVRPFKLWDGDAWVWRRPSAPTETFDHQP